MNRQKKVLVIDNDDALRSSLAATFNTQGFDVLQADTASMGVQLARTELPDLILCDTDLGRVGGDLVLYAVRRDPNLCAIPFILMSRFGIKELPPLGVGRGADGFLAKPFTPEKLATTVRACLESGAKIHGETQTGSGKRRPDGTNKSLKGLLRPLKRVMEATWRISTGHERLEMEEIIGLANQAHHTVSRLHKRIEDSLDTDPVK